MPRKVTVYIAGPPGDGLEKSRVWFREYVKVSLYFKNIYFSEILNNNNKIAYSCCWCS